MRQALTLTQEWVDEFQENIARHVKQKIAEEQIETDKKIAAGDKAYKLGRDALIGMISDQSDRISYLEGQIEQINKQAGRAVLNNCRAGRERGRTKRVILKTLMDH